MSKSYLPNVDHYKLDNFGWNQISWLAHTYKANLILMVLILIIIINAYEVGSILQNGQCLADRTTPTILIAVDLAIITFAYFWIWPYTKWTKPDANSSKFIGAYSIIAQQAQPDIISNINQKIEATSNVPPLERQNTILNLTSPSVVEQVVPPVEQAIPPVSAISYNNEIEVFNENDFKEKSFVEGISDAAYNFLWGNPTHP